MAHAEAATGSLSILNVGAGDIEVNFNPHDTQEAKKAIKMLTDMQTRGYAILIRDAEGAYQRAVSIDAARGRYIIMLPEDAPLPADAEEVTAPPKRRRGRPRKVSVPVTGRHAVGVARSAGG